MIQNEKKIYDKLNLSSGKKNNTILYTEQKYEKKNYIYEKNFVKPTKK